MKMTKNGKLKWHNWFAWHPVMMNGKWAWFCCVMRKGRLSTRKSFCIGDTRPYKDACYDEVYWAWEYADSRS